MQHITSDEMDAISRTRKGGPTADETEAYLRGLHKTYAPDLPRKLFDRAYGRAYDEGHSSGYANVENCLDDYIGLIYGVMSDLGIDLAGTYGNQS